MSEHATTAITPRLLDAFCCAGGATKGYQQAGFHVTGVDITAHKNYCGDEFIHDDAMDLLADPAFLAQFDAIHASPPCQGYSAMSACRPGLADTYPRLIEPVRAALIASGRPYVIENVPGSPLIDPVVLCGTMFGYELYRHRLFESNVAITVPDHPEHVMPASKAGHWKPGTVMSVAGHFAPVAHGRKVMDIDWMNREEMAEAIPPYYTEHVGRHLLAALDHKQEAAA